MYYYFFTERLFVRTIIVSKVQVKHRMRPQTFIVNQTLIILQEHHALFMRKSLQVNHRQNTQKERARYCKMGREGERRDRARVQRGFNRG